MVFRKHEGGRKDWGLTRASQTVSCYKCGKEIEMGAIFYSKIRHSKWSCKLIGYICDPCYQSLFIDI